jgi:hypothetical protein
MHGHVKTRNFKRHIQFVVFPSEANLRHIDPYKGVQGTEILSNIADENIPVRCLSLIVGLL